MPGSTLRIFDTASDSDYESLATVTRAAKPEYPLTVAELKEEDALSAKAGTPWMRVLAVDSGGTPVGFAEFEPSWWQPGPGKFFVRLLVRPEFHGEGVGKSLYNALWEEMARHDPTYIKIEWREDMARAVRFFTERGWTEASRWYESRLDLAGFDFASFADDFDRPLAEGITIASWHELKTSDPDADHKMWQAAMDMLPDVPSDEPFAPMPFDEFQSVVMSRPNLDHDGFFVAVDARTGDYVGISHIWRRQADNDLDTGLTATKRSHRRKGIALALKLRVLQWAQQNGFRALRTGNEVNNRPMLAINERLGFTKQPPWIEFVWRP
ncbi:MAG: GNAT family N-acetyltransferase [Akkermansiaceae bacterium]|nr:GNAT family N-acetyltransferase [Armatimonadota bacterium]